MELETFLLVRSEILQLFVNSLIADGKYSLHKTRNLPQPNQKHWPWKPKAFCGYFFHFQNLHKILKIFQENMSLID